MAGFDFKGAEQEGIRGVQSSFYRAVQGWYLSYGEVRLALWKTFREEYGRIACVENGFELCLEHDLEDVISAVFTQIEEEIDNIYISKHGDQEWEEAGMTYFRKICGNHWRTPGIPCWIPN